MLAPYFFLTVPSLLQGRSENVDALAGRFQRLEFVGVRW